MKRIALVSVAVAALLLTGCQKKESSTQANAQTQQTQQTQAPKAQASAPQAAKPAAEPAQKTEAAKAAPSVTQQAKEAAKSATQAVKEKAQESVNKAKEAVAAATGGATASASADKGKELFAKCAACHGPNGEKHALGKSGIIGGMAKDELVKKIKGYKAGTLNQYGMGALMHGQVASLSDADIEALATYISSLKK